MATEDEFRIEAEHYRAEAEDHRKTIDALVAALRDKFCPRPCNERQSISMSGIALMLANAVAVQTPHLRLRTEGSERWVLRIG